MRKTILAIAILSMTIGCKKEETANPIVENQKPIEQLIFGNQRFLNEKSIHPHQDKKTVLKNQNEQHPFAIVLTCSDSRVSPEVLFDQGLGDLFVIRNAGNLISDIDMGSIEYAVEHLDVQLIVVLGHTECGAVKAYIADKDNLYKKHLSHIDDIVATLAQEKEEKAEEKKMPKGKNLLGSINANIAHSTTLIEQNPIVKKKHTKIVSMRYDVHSGKIVQL